MRTKKAYLWTVSVLVLGFLSAQAGSAPIVPVSSTFDTGLDGWVIDPASIGTLSFVPNGGNPGGFLQIADTGPAGNGALAPSKFLGDWSGLDGVGELSWDSKVIRFGTYVGNVGTLIASISGPGGSAAFDSGIVASDQQWLTATAPIEQTAWSIVSGTWQGLLTNVTQLRINLEVVNNNTSPLEINGLDNVCLDIAGQACARLPSVPEPATLTLMGLGIAGLGYQRRRQTAKA